MRILGDRRQSHGSIRTRLTVVVVFSAIALVAMWALVSIPRLYDAIYLRAVTDAMQKVMPRATEALSSVQQERAQSLLQLGSGSGELTDRRVRTDQAVKGVRELVEPVLARSPQAVQDKYAEFNRTIDRLPGIRRQVDAKSIGRPELYGFYNNLTDASIAVFDSMAHAVPDQQTAFSGVEVNSLFHAAELMSRSSTLVSGAINAGSLNSADHAEFARVSGAYRQQLEMSTQNASTDVKTRYRELLASDDWKRLGAAEEKLINTGPWTVVSGNKRTDGQLAAPPVSEQEWRDVTGKVYTSLEQLGVRQFAESSRLASDKSASGLTEAILGSVLALLVAILTIVIALRIMRTTARRLTRLRYETLDLAVEKLPPIVRRLRAGEQVDVSTELPELDFGRDEIGQVARAFNAAHTTAVEAAVQESQARAGIRNVFLGIAHRSQALVHRQLKILDKLEREEEDPKQLEALFGLDHLATRARRNAENLIILGGQQPGRAWRKPILLADILRGAIAETTQYKRVRLQGVPRAMVMGSAVADVMHLLAELLDNATSFSPPQSQVRLYGEPAAKGVVIEVEDNGLGMSAADRDRHNAVLADPPDFDTMALKGDPRLGLFVVARLAARHGIRVELRSSSYGGTRAIVLIPATLLVDDDTDSAETTAVLDPVRGPAPEYIDDVLPFRVTLAPQAETTTSLKVEERPPAAPEWPREEAPEPPASQPRPEIAPPRAGEHSMDLQPRPALPRRRRQASLAPQLRDAAAFTPEQADADPGHGRSPEEIRSIMSAFHKESRRARDSSGDDE
ncbi:sensor histidine kinase [Actinocrispum sp. NPDC049592]|uniref:sensor histidine kinase n=1 Tax=Actinocrispum sp. NPDC049592 TaxID=3154835 RepID=UPI00342811D6